MSDGRTTTIDDFRIEKGSDVPGRDVGTARGRSLTSEATAVSAVVSDKLGQYLEHHRKESSPAMLGRASRNIINKAVVSSREGERASF